MRPVLIVHRDQSYTDNLQQLLQTFGIEVETFDHPNGYLACGTFSHAHVALIGTIFDDLDGLDIVLAASERSSATSVFLVAENPSVREVVRAMRNGAQDVLVRPFSVDPVLQAARSDESMPTGTPSTSANITASLSAREQEVLRLLIKGQTSEDMASALNISRRTIEAHRANIYKKLGVRNRMQMLNRIRRTS